MESRRERDMASRRGRRFWKKWKDRATLKREHRFHRLRQLYQEGQGKEVHQSSEAAYLEIVLPGSAGVSNLLGKEFSEAACQKNWNTKIAYLHDAQILLQQQYFASELGGQRPVIGIRFPRVPANNPTLRQVHASFWKQLKGQWIDAGKDVIVYLDEDDLMDEIEHLRPLLESDRLSFDPIKGKHTNGFTISTLPHLGSRTIQDMVKDYNHLRNTGKMRESAW